MHPNQSDLRIYIDNLSVRANLETALADGTLLRTVWSESLIDASLEDLLRQVALENTKAFEAFYARTSAKTMSIVLAIIR